MSDEQDAHAKAIIQSLAADTTKIIAQLHRSVEAAVEETAAILQEAKAHLDRLIVDTETRIDVLERGYVVGSSDVRAGDPATRDRIELGRMLLEMAREGREQLSVIAARMEPT